MSPGHLVYSHCINYWRLKYTITYKQHVQKKRKQHTTQGLGGTQRYGNLSEVRFRNFRQQFRTAISMQQLWSAESSPREQGTHDNECCTTIQTLHLYKFSYTPVLSQPDPVHCLPHLLAIQGLLPLIASKLQSQCSLALKLCVVGYTPSRWWRLH